MSVHVAPISGGATGIGKMVARKLVSRGVSVVLSGRRRSVGEAAVAELASVAERNAQVRFIRNDVSDEDAVKPRRSTHLMRRLTEEGLSFQSVQPVER